MDLHGSPNESPRTRARHHRHRHTQSLGLLSPIPSRTSLRSDAEMDAHAEVEEPTIQRANMKRTRTPLRGGTPVSAAGTPLDPPHSSPRRAARASLPPLPALLASLSALFPGSAPSSPKVATIPIPTETESPKPHQQHQQHPVPVTHAPQPRRAVSSFTPYNGSPASPSPRHPQQQQQREQQQAQTQTPAPSRSEALLRDIALRRGSSASSSAPTGFRSRAGSHSAVFTPSPGHAGGQARAYGGDAEFSPAHQHQHHAPSTANAALAQTLSRLEGRSPHPHPHAQTQRDPEHEALRARLERVLALSGGGASPDRRASGQSAGSGRTSSVGGSGGSERRASVSTSASEKRGSVQSAQSGGSGSGSGSQEGRSRDRERQQERTETPKPTQVGEEPRTPTPRRRRGTNDGGNAASPGLRSPVSPHPHAQHAPSPYYRTTPTPRPRTPLNQEGTPRRRTFEGSGESPYAQAHESPRYRAASPSPNSPRAQQQQYRTSSPSPTSPHSPHPTNLHHSPLYRTASPRIPDGELARRHTTTATPTASPRRAQFGVPLPPTSPPGHLRQRSKTEPYGVAGESYGIPALEEQQQPRERPHGEGHGRKSSAYAALAALSGLGVGHPNSRTGHVRGGGGSLSQSAPNGASGQVTTPGSTPPLSADVRDESASESDDGGDEDVDGNRRKRRGRGTNGRLLTPPATPPRCSLVVVGDELVCGSGGACVHDGDPRPAFNARKASAQCRQLEGYVSFAAVEGLGEPPSPGPDGDLDDEEAGKKRGSLGAGIVGFWKGGFW